MRTLGSTLITAQGAASRSPYVRLYFDDRNGTTYTFTTRDATNRIVYVNQWEEPYAGMAIIRLKNHDNYFPARDLRGYSVSVGWGMVLDSTPDSTWYSNAAVMKVIMQRDTSYQGEAVTEFHCVAIWAEIQAGTVLAAGKKLTGTMVNGNAFTLGETITGSVSNATGRLAGIGSNFIIVTRVSGTFQTSEDADGASASVDALSAVADNYGPMVYASGDTSTEARIESITGLTVDVDEDDPDGSMADTPRLEVPIGVSNRAVIRKMMLRTKCGLRYESDGKIHALYLDTADPANYYFDNDHAFFANLRERAIIMPNTVIFVDALPSADGTAATYIGTANEATSVAAIGAFTTVQIDPDLASDAEAATRAAAWISQMVSQAYQGQILAPMECGLEVYDVVQASDLRIALSSKGRIGRIERTFEPRWDVYDVAITLGSLYSYPGNMDTGPASRDNDLKDLTDNLDKKPPSKALQLLAWQLGPALLPITIDIDFTAVDNDDVSWGSGTITFADKSTQAIDAGSLNLANANAYYLYATEGDSSLNNTQTFGDAVGDDKFLVAFLLKAPATNQKAMIVPAKGGKSPLLNADNISANCITATEIYVSQLSAITADIGLITTGELRIGTGTIGSNFTGWRMWVDTSVGRMAGYASDVLQWYSDTDGKLYAGAGKVRLDSDGLATIGAYYDIYKVDGTTLAGTLGYFTTGNLLTLGTDNDVNLSLSSDGDLNLVPVNTDHRVNITRLETTQTDVGASRAIDGTVYQAGAHPLIVTVVVNGTTGTITAYVEVGDATPDIAVAQEYIAAGNRTVTFPVPAYAYYSVASAGCVLASWFETAVGG